MMKEDCYLYKCNKNLQFARLDLVLYTKMINRGGWRVARGCFDEGYVIEYKQSQ